jgi:hypothetical protein
MTKEFKKKKEIMIIIINTKILNIFSLLIF